MVGANFAFIVDDELEQIVAEAVRMNTPSCVLGAKMYPNPSKLKKSKPEAKLWKISQPIRSVYAFPPSATSTDNEKKNNVVFLFFFHLD